MRMLFLLVASRLLASSMAVSHAALSSTTAPAGVLDATSSSAIDLADVSYSFPSQQYRFESQQQPLEMSYMDIAPADPAKANGRTVLLLHGKNFNGDYWGETARDLSAAGFRVVVPDQIGFGKSTKPDRYQFSFQQLAQNTTELLDSLRIDRVEVVGHSMGGMLATRFALMYPQRVTRLALVNPIGLEDWKTVLPYRSVDQNYQSELKQSAESIRGYMQRVYYNGKWKPEYDRPVEILASMTKAPDYPRAAWCNALTTDMCITQPVVYEFPNLKVPTLLIIGTRDRTALGRDAAPPEVAEKLGRYDLLGKNTAAAIPGAKLVELNDVGHVPMLEVYERYIKPLKSFLSE